jgi:hypothetical protein
MEGSGVTDATWTYGLGYLVVQGICDYSDANKNDVWQNYVATAARAYVRAVLEAMPGAAPPTELDVCKSLSPRPIRTAPRPDPWRSRPKRRTGDNRRTGPGY